MKYLVIWTLTWLAVAPCPDPLRDEFNRQPQCQYSPVEEKSRMHSRVFDNRDSAFAFLGRLESARSSTETTAWVESIGSIKIDSLKY